MWTKVFVRFCLFQWQLPDFKADSQKPWSGEVFFLIVYHVEWICHAVFGKQTDYTEVKSFFFFS